MRITAVDLQQLGVVDRIVPEPVGGAHRDNAAAIATLGTAIEEALAEAGSPVARARYAGRAAAASPATGLMKRNQAEQGALVADALGHNVRDEIRRTRQAEGDRANGKAAS